MHPRIKKASLSAVALAALAATCWLGLRGRSDPHGPGLVNQGTRVVPAEPAMTEPQRPTGDPGPTTAVARTGRHENRKTLDRKPRRRGERRTKTLKVYPQS